MGKRYVAEAGGGDRIMEQTKKNMRRSGIVIMGQLIGLIKPLLPIMLMAILFGVVGFLCAIFITILASFGVLEIIGLQVFSGMPDLLIDPSGIFAGLILLAVFRGILHYAEQYCNHYIAFKLLAIIRSKVFEVLRKLSPAKLEGRDKGNLISIITSDIELLEVFYAHTISPIAIAILTSILMVIFIGSYSFYAGLLALAAYIGVGALIPLLHGGKGAQTGLQVRNLL